MCGMTTGTLSTYASKARRKVVYTNEYVDSSIEPNKSFLEKWQDKNYTPIIANSVKPEPVKQPRITRSPTLKEMSSEIEQEEESEKEEVYGLDAKKLATQILKMEKEIEKLTLSNAKSQGEVVPVGLMDALFLQERQSILIESKNTLTDILAILAKRRDLTASERSDISAEFVDRLNETMKRAANTTEKAIHEIVAQFSIKRGKGERV